MSEFRTDNAALMKFLSSPTGQVANRLKEVATEITGVAKVICPRKTRELTKSINWVMRQEGSGLVAYVGTNKEYAIFVHEGTGPHRIKARGKKALAFDWANGPSGVTRSKRTGKVVRKFVNHPGTKGRPFLTDAAKRVLGAGNVRT